MGFDFNFFLVALKAAIKYTPVTLFLAFLPLIIGIIIGAFIAIARVFKVRVLGRLSQIYVVIIKGIPIVLQLLIVNAAIIQGFDAAAEKLHLSVHSKDVNNLIIPLIALSFFSTANISEIMRGALVSVDEGQYEASYSVGMTKVQTLIRIILPQIIPVAVPMLCSSLIGLIKGSSLAFMVSVTELLNGALITANSNYNFLEAYVAAAVVYWALSIIIERISYILEKRLSVYARRGII